GSQTAIAPAAGVGPSAVLPRASASQVGASAWTTPPRSDRRPRAYHVDRPADPNSGLLVKQTVPPPATWPHERPSPPPALARNVPCRTSVELWAMRAPLPRPRPILRCLRVRRAPRARPWLQEATNRHTPLGPLLGTCQRMRPRPRASVASGGKAVCFPAARTASLHVARGRERTAMVSERCFAVSDGMAVRRTRAVRDLAAETAGAAPDTAQARTATASAMGAFARARGGTRRADREASLT